VVVHGLRQRESGDSRESVDAVNGVSKRTAGESVWEMLGGQT
jgi:hypothetical protein